MAEASIRHASINVVTASTTSVARPMASRTSATSGSNGSPGYRKRHAYSVSVAARRSRSSSEGWCSRHAWDQLADVMSVAEGVIVVRAGRLQRLLDGLLAVEGGIGRQRRFRSQTHVGRPQNLPPPNEPSIDLLGTFVRRHGAGGPPS